MKTTLFVHRGVRREALSSLAGIAFLARESAYTFRRISNDNSAEAVTCSYYGSAVLKGVTDFKTGVTVVGIPRRQGKGLHADLVKGFPGVDPPSKCYDQNHRRGFGSFVRWAAFVDDSARTVIGVDYHPDGRVTAGVSVSVTQVSDIARHLIMYEAAPNLELRLLSHHMLELAEHTELRRNLRLLTLADWASASRLWYPVGEHCLRCGQPTRTHQKTRVCTGCGHAYHKVHQAVYA